jgi:galactitol-specific phosphotransferase system IIB component
MRATSLLERLTHHTKAVREATSGTDLIVPSWEVRYEIQEEPEGRPRRSKAPTG